MLTELPKGPFSIVYADPPWRYGDRSCSGAAAKEYETMALDEIKAMPVADSAATDCMLFMWATWPLLPQAIEVMRAWGFDYKTIGFLWVKKNKSDCGHFFGLGRWTRGNSEVCLMGTRGKPKRVSMAVEQLCFEPLTRHSAKPAVIRDRIVELLGDLPRVELFARSVTHGWTSWGNELPKGVHNAGTAGLGAGEAAP